jgi:hypothetical protein
VFSYLLLLLLQLLLARYMAPGHAVSGTANIGHTKSINYTFF